MNVENDLYVIKIKDQSGNIIMNFQNNIIDYIDYEQNVENVENISSLFHASYP